jgi:SPP1 gp7 family putative phage head morphogenesis protein
MTINANTQIYDKTVDRAAMIRLYEKRVNGKVEVIIDGHAVRVDKLIKEAETSDIGFQKLRYAIDEDIRRTYRQAFNLSSRELVEFSNDQYSFTFGNIARTMKRIWNPNPLNARIPEEIVLERPIYKNRTLEASWSHLAQAERKRIEAIIRKGLSEGLSTNDISKMVRKGSAFRISKFHSKGLVTTAITAIRAQVDHEIFKANEDALLGWQYIAILDSRTTPICRHRDGQIFPISDVVHLPPAHYYCRSTTNPVFKSWEDISKLESLGEVRRRNLETLTKKEISFYDGQTPLKESYHDWLQRQKPEIQLRHLGDYKKLELFRTGKIHADKFTSPEGKSVGLKELKAMSLSGQAIPNDTRRFALAKEKLDSMKLGAVTPDDFYNNPDFAKVLKDFYILQSRELDGTLSLTNYRGMLIGSKKGVKARVLSHPPREDQVIFNPITGRYEDSRLYRPNPKILENSLRLVNNSESLLNRDKEFIIKFVNNLSDEMSVNERAVIAENLRITFGRFRDNGELWNNFKAVSQSQIKFDVMNISDNLETQIRKDGDILKKLLQDNYIDPVLGPTQLQDLHDNFIKNILAKNNWEDRIAPKIARELRSIFHVEIPPLIHLRVNNTKLNEFYLKFAQRLALADTPDRDQLAVSLGRDLYNLANLNGDRKKWYDLGLKLLNSSRASKFYEIETFGVQKRRMKSRMSGKYFGPYYDTLSYNIRITDPRIQNYAKLTRSVELGLRIPITEEKNRLLVRPGYKTYFIDRGLLGLEDTRIPITSTSSFSEFPEEFIDKNFSEAMNWASQSKYKVDTDFYNFINKLLYFEDDKGKAKHYNERNEYRHYIAGRGDAYERFKAMEWLTKNDKSFSNIAFIDHRARIYERGFIGPQSGETFRPFLNTAEEKNFSPELFNSFKDQIGSFLGGLSDAFEGRYNSLSFPGRQKIAEKWWPELVNIGDLMRKGKPNDIRKILDSELIAQIDGEELGKFLRFAIESSKLNSYLQGDYSKESLKTLSKYKIGLALEQDASSSGAQIIALTTRNKQLAELSNVVPTDYKKRLYDEIAGAAFEDPRFIELNKKLGLTEKDLRKAAKMQNMVTLYGAGERTGALQVEDKLAKILEKTDNTLVVKASERDQVLDEISARMARYEKFDPETYLELKELRQNVKDIFNKGLSFDNYLIEQLYFLNNDTAAIVDKMTSNYGKVVTPQDFRQIALIMSEKLAERTPILKDFTRFFGRLAEDYLSNAKPSKADFDWESVVKTQLLGVQKKGKKKGYTLPPRVSEILGLKANEPISEKFLKRFEFWVPEGNLSQIIYGVKAPKTRRTGAKYFKLEFDLPAIRKQRKIKLSGIELFKANKLPKSWTNVPWVNFDGKILEQHFTQTFEERLAYKNADGTWTTNILQIPQKTDATWWEQAINKKGAIYDIADLTNARTAFAVNGNHSNDATLVKNFHLWGKKNKISTSTIHDAFFTNISDMLEAREALRQLYGKALDINIIEEVLKEMKARGLPEGLYMEYLNEAKDNGLIPIPGRSKVGGKILTKDDILTKEDILKEIPKDFKKDFGWYGVG